MITFNSTNTRSPVPRSLQENGREDQQLQNVVNALQRSSYTFGSRLVMNTTRLLIHISPLRLHFP